MRHGLAVTLGCLALSACGGDGNGESAGGSEPKLAIEPEAQERAESIVLTLSDFPRGWRAEEAAGEGEADLEVFNDCVGADYSGFILIGEGQSDDFAMGETAVASSSVAVFESEQMATQAFAERAESLEGDQADTCLPELLGEPPGDVEMTSAEIGELSFTPPAGVDDAGAWQLAVQIEGKAGSQDEDLSVTVYGDLVALRNGDTITTVTTTDIASTFDPELRDQLVTAVAGRVSE